MHSSREICNCWVMSGIAATETMLTPAKELRVNFFEK
jgi:hypothetical protein